MSPREKVTPGQKIFWTVIAISSVACGFYGYERFKLIRPDLYDARYQPSVSETERKSRIAEYQQRGDALTRLGNGSMRAPSTGEICADGYVVTMQRPTSPGSGETAVRVVEHDKPVRCAPLGPPHP